MNRKPNSAFAVIDYGRTVGTCMDIYCPCGNQVHHDADSGKAAEHIRCPWCKDVLRIGADVNLLTAKEDFSVDHGPCVFIQWKGSDIVMQGNCTCGEKFDILGWFQYECECPACHTHYHCESHLTLTKLSAEEAASVELVSDVEKDLEDMTDAEREQYEARMQAAWEREHTCTYPPLRRALSGNVLGDPLLLGHTHVGCTCKGKQSGAGGPAEIGYLADPAQPLIAYSNYLRQAEGADVIVLNGDYLDGVGTALPDLSGKQVKIMPDVHFADFGTRRRRNVFVHGVRHDSGTSDLNDLFALSRWPTKAETRGVRNDAKPGGNRKTRRANRRKGKS